MNMKVNDAYKYKTEKNACENCGYSALDDTFLVVLCVVIFCSGWSNICSL